MNAATQESPHLWLAKRWLYLTAGLSRRTKLASLLLLAAGAACFTLAFAGASSLRFTSIFVWCGAMSLFIAAVLLKRHPVFLLFCLTFCFFHFGLLPLYGLNMASTGPDFLPWYETNGGRSAIFGSTLFLIGLHLSLISEPSRDSTPSARDGASFPDQVAYTVAFGALCVGCAVWFAYMLAVGAGNYRDYIAHFAGNIWGNRIIRADYSLIAAAAFLCALYGRRPLAAAAVFALWGAAVFAVGPRNEVVLPGLIVIAILVARGQLKLPWWGWAASILVVLTASSAAALVRWDSSALVRVANSSPLAGLAELGWSLRPVVVVLEWIEAGDPLRWGQTYIVPFDRYLGAILPGWNRVPADQDSRLMNVLVADRVGQIGFSMVAEAIINFGMWASMPLGFIVGSVVTIAGRLAASRRHILLALPLLALFFVHIRQSWATSVATATFTLAALISLLIAIFLIRILIDIYRRSHLK